MVLTLKIQRMELSSPERAVYL